VPVLPVFRWLAATGGIAETEMLRTFNCGIGMIVVRRRQGRCRYGVFAREGETVARLGDVIARAGERARRLSGKLDSGHEPQARRDPDLGPRLQHGGADRGAQAPSYPAEIALVCRTARTRPGSNRAQAGVDDRAARPQAVRQGPRRVRGRLQAILDQHAIELICLGGFMRLFTASFVQRWHGGCSTSTRRCCRRFPGSIRTARRCAPA
jgi:hypothetical protein